MVNELIQWVVLAFMAVFVVGLTRHLGQFMVSQREQVADEYGPDRGERLAEGVLSAADHRRLVALMGERRSTWASLVVVNEMCDACDAWLEAFQAVGRPADAPLAILTGKSSDEHMAKLEAVSDFVVRDETGDRLHEANLRATPFLMVVDGDLKVRYKQVGGSPHEGVTRWRSKSKDLIPVVKATPSEPVHTSSNGGS